MRDGPRGGAAAAAAAGGGVSPVAVTVALITIVTITICAAKDSRTTSISTRCDGIFAATHRSLLITVTITTGRVRVDRRRRAAVARRGPYTPTPDSLT